MDGFEPDTGVLVIAATNRPEALDVALCRPGRFSRRVFVREPDADGRRKILAVHLRGIPLEQDPEMICNMVASFTPGFVGADLANIVNEAALLAARRGGDAVTVDDLKEAVRRAKYGIGLRSGSTASMAIEELGKLVQQGKLKDVLGVGASYKSHILARQFGVKTVDLNDVYIHPSAKIHPTAKIGPNVSISANAQAW